MVFIFGNQDSPLSTWPPLPWPIDEVSVQTVVVNVPVGYEATWTRAQYGRHLLDHESRFA